MKRTPCHKREIVMPTDTARLNAIEEQCAEIELTCGGVWRVSSVDGDFEAPDLRTAIDAMMSRPCPGPLDCLGCPECASQEG